MQLLVEAELTPRQAIRCATCHTAEVQDDANNRDSWQDRPLLVFDADPLAEIRNTTRLVGELVADGRLAGGGLGKGGTGTILVNGKKVAEGKIDRTQPNFFSADEGADVGLDGETPVTDDYQEGDTQFTGKIRKATVELK